MYRVLRVHPRLARDGADGVVLRGGTQIYYRRNRGDLHSLREVWLAETYRLPFRLTPRTVVDLGANIGLTSAWLRAHYEVERLVAVEPSAANVRVLRQNLPWADTTIVHAAVGPMDGTVRFEDSRESHLGRVSRKGARVRQVSMLTILAELEPGLVVDLLKVDIEGFEGELFSGDLTWLVRIRAIIIEIHPPVVDRDDIVRRIEAQGFRFVPAESTWPGSMDAFVRPEDDECARSGA